jgi:hypothetical protein
MPTEGKRVPVLRRKAPSLTVIVGAPKAPTPMADAMTHAARAMAPEAAMPETDAPEADTPNADTLAALRAEVTALRARLNALAGEDEDEDEDDDDLLAG